MLFCGISLSMMELHKTDNGRLIIYRDNAPPFSLTTDEARALEQALGEVRSNWQED